MNLKLLTACVLANLALSAVAISAETSAKSTAAQPIKETATVERRATITAIDASTRLVTLKGQDGQVFQVTAGPEIANFDKLQVGDVVVANYTESLALEIAAPGAATPGITGSVSGTPAPGKRAMNQQVTATFKVEAVDAAANKVTLSDGAGNSRTIDVRHPKAQERLKTLKPGEMAVITYTESLALRLEKVSGK
jgi:Cu/Ag efflux protein CusF